MITQIVITTLLTSLLLLVEHWLPWRAILGKDLPRVPSYIAGVLAIALPLTGLYLQWSHCPPGWPLAHLAALWATILGGGSSVVLAYRLDGLIVKLAELRDLKEIIQLKEDTDETRPLED